MTDFFKSLFLLILSETCYNEYFVKYNFMHAPCLTATLSKGLGVGIIAGSVLVKVPQIIKIWKNKSGEGISIYGVYLELFAITANFAYSYVMGFPFSAWGEGTFLAVQTAIIAALVLKYKGETSTAAMFLATYVGAVAVLVSGYAPTDILWLMQAVNVPTIVVAKSLQVYFNYKRGSTGQLSAITLLLLFGGSIARIFTSYVETGDVLIIVTYCVSTIANGAIVCQLFWYWNVDSSKNKIKKKKK